MGISLPRETMARALLNLLRMSFEASAKMEEAIDETLHFHNQSLRGHDFDLSQ
jgi:hypothetical protein